MFKIHNSSLVSVEVEMEKAEGAGEPELLWEKRYDSGGTDIAHDVAVDKNDNIIITGESSYDYYTIKYDSNGNQLWGIRYNSGFTDRAYGIATDSNNNVVVTGVGGDPRNGDSNFFTVKYDPYGNKLWSDNFFGTGSIWAYDVAIDSVDNIVATGYFVNYHPETGLNNTDFITIKYDASGRKLWYKIYDNSAGRASDMAYGVAIDSEDNVIVSGTSDNNFVTVKYDANGNELWNRTLDNGSYDNGLSVAVDSLDNIIVAGTSYDTANNTDYAFLIKYDSYGRELWRKRSFNGKSLHIAVAINSLNNNIVVAGKGSYANYSDYYTIAYDPRGNVLWEEIYDGGLTDMSSGVAVDSLDNVIVTGYSFNGATGDYLTLKYGYPTISIPLASFIATPTSGEAPLTVNFTDASTNNPTSWNWDFDNNGSIDSTLQNPSHTYTAPNIYTVSLTVSNQGGTNTKTIPNFITVTAPDTIPPAVSITEPLNNAVVKDTIIIKANASDNRGVNRVEFYIDNTLYYSGKSRQVY